MSLGCVPPATTRPRQEKPQIIASGADRNTESLVLAMKHCGKVTVDSLAPCCCWMFWTYPREARTPRAEGKPSVNPTFQALMHVHQSVQTTTLGSRFKRGATKYLCTSRTLDQTVVPPEPTRYMITHIPVRPPCAPSSTWIRVRTSGYLSISPLVASRRLQREQRELQDHHANPALPAPGQVRPAAGRGVLQGSAG